MVPGLSSRMLTVRSVALLEVTSATLKFCTPWRWMPPVPFMTDAPVPVTDTVAAPASVFANRAS